MLSAAGLATTAIGSRGSVLLKQPRFLIGKAHNNNLVFTADRFGPALPLLGVTCVGSKAFL